MRPLCDVSNGPSDHIILYQMRARTAPVTLGAARAGGTAGAAAATGQSRPAEPEPARRGGPSPGLTTPALPHVLVPATIDLPCVDVRQDSPRRAGGFTVHAPTFAVLPSHSHFTRKNVTSYQKEKKTDDRIVIGSVNFYSYSA